MRWLVVVCCGALLLGGAGCLRVRQVQIRNGLSREVVLTWQRRVPANRGFENKVETLILRPGQSKMVVNGDW